MSCSTRGTTAKTVRIDLSANHTVVLCHRRPRRASSNICRRKIIADHDRLTIAYGDSDDGFHLERVLSGGPVDQGEECDGIPSATPTSGHSARDGFIDAPETCDERNRGAGTLPQARGRATVRRDGPRHLHREYVSGRL
jgi:hypothetical protein